MIIVVDASAVLEVLLQTAAGAPMTPRLLSQDTSLHAPHLLDLEVAQVLRRFVRQGEVLSTFRRNTVRLGRPATRA